VMVAMPKGDLGFRKINHGTGYSRFSGELEPLIHAVDAAFGQEWVGRLRQQIRELGVSSMTRNHRKRVVPSCVFDVPPDHSVNNFMRGTRIIMEESALKKAS